MNYMKKICDYRELLLQLSGRLHELDRPDKFNGQSFKGSLCLLRLSSFSASPSFYVTGTFGLLPSRNFISQHFLYAVYSGDTF